MLWTGFSLRLSLYFGALSFSSTLTSPSVPAAEKQPHSMRLLPAHFTFGMVLCRWWAELVPFKHDAWNWGSSDQRILFLTVWGSFRCFFVNSKCVFFCLHWGEDWVWPHQHKHRSVECCSDVCPSVGSFYLHIWSWSSTRVTIRFFVTTLTKALLHQLLSLARRPSLKSPCCSKRLPLWIMEATCFCEPSVQQNFFWTLPQMCGLMQSCLWAIQAKQYYLRAWYLL